MLVLGRKPVFRGLVGPEESKRLLARVGHGIRIGPDIVVRVLEVDGAMVRIGIDAPLSIVISRDELPRAEHDAEQRRRDGTP
jgi:carbon storage regulator CsrA